jgi:uncharacterized protein
MKMKWLKTLATVLVVVGGINWGLIGLMTLLGQGSFNLVNMLFGSIPKLEAVVYLLVGVAAVFKIKDLID